MILGGIPLLRAAPHTCVRHCVFGSLYRGSRCHGMFFQTRAHCDAICLLHFCFFCFSRRGARGCVQGDYQAFYHNKEFIVITCSLFSWAGTDLGCIFCVSSVELKHRTANELFIFSLPSAVGWKKKKKIPVNPVMLFVTLSGAIHRGITED